MMLTTPPRRTSKELTPGAFSCSTEMKEGEVTLGNWLGCRPMAPLILATEKATIYLANKYPFLETDCLWVPLEPVASSARRELFTNFKEPETVNLS